MTDREGTAEKLVFDIVALLQSHDEIMEVLPERRAVYQSHPADSRDYPIEITITPIYDGSEPDRGIRRRTIRIQASVKAQFSWREQQDRADTGTTATYEMQSLLSIIGDELDRGERLGFTARGAESGVAPQEMPGNRLAMIGDWTFTSYVSDDVRPSQQ